MKEPPSLKIYKAKSEDHPEESYYCISTLFTDENGNLCSGIWYYYYLLMKRKITNYQNVWSFIIENKTQLNNGSRFEEHYNYIADQYSYLIFNNDQILNLERKEKADNDDVFLIIYFAYNLILSAKLILDIFAWIIKDAYFENANLRDSEISLIFSKYDLKGAEKHNKYKKELKKIADTKLVEYICSNELQKSISRIEEHRDIISHKGRIHIMRHSTAGDDTVSVMKPVNPKVFRTVTLDEAYRLSNGKDIYEKCSKLSSDIFAALDPLFIHINESILKHLDTQRQNKGETR